MLNEMNIPLEEDGIEEEILVDEEVAITKAMWGDIGGNIANQTDLQNALDAKQDSLTEAQLNAVNSGITSEKVTTYDGYADQIASKANQSALNAESITRGEADTALGTRIDNEALARQNADNGLQSQIDAITSKSDVVDVVADYAALQAYDTSSLGNNDVIKVLDDEMHEDALTYYRWSTTTQTWSYIGQEAPYYSKGQMDVMLQGKQDKLTAGANIQIQNGTISATDTTYTAGNGLNLNGTEFSADTDVLATKEDLEGYYTKPETDNLLAPKLEAEVVAELPATGAEGKLYLTPKEHTTQTATGNPITATVTEDAGKIESFQLDGDTFQQSYEGKNLLEPKMASATSKGITCTNNGDGSFTLNGTASATATFRLDQSSSNASDNLKNYSGTYTLSCDELTDGMSLYVMQINTWTQYLVMRNSNTPVTGSVDANGIFIYVGVFGGTKLDNLTIRPMFEKSATATTYEPYVGGVPSPNPEYPQPIQTVTGTQTISINGTDYSLNLGDIELCKLGTYQDYIWKDGEDWKVHKATANTTYDGSSDEVWSKSNSTANQLFIGRADGMSKDNSVTVVAKSDKFTYIVRDTIYAQSKIGFTTQTTGDNYAAIRVGLGLDSTVTTVALFREYLGENITTVYYPLETPTDTVITDQTLITQLEAIRTASLENGTNTITNTATGSNLAGDMEIGYYSYNPTNRYDKWLWLDINNNYEKIGS